MEKTQISLRFTKKEIKRLEELKIFFKEKTYSKVIKNLIKRKIEV